MRQMTVQGVLDTYLAVVLVEPQGGEWQSSKGAIPRMEGWAGPYQDYLVETVYYGGSLRVKSPDWI